MSKQVHGQIQEQVQNTLVFAHIYDTGARLRPLGTLPEEGHQFVYCVELGQDESQARPYLREELTSIQSAPRKRRKPRKVEAPQRDDEDDG